MSTKKLSFCDRDKLVQEKLASLVDGTEKMSEMAEHLVETEFENKTLQNDIEDMRECVREQHEVISKFSEYLFWRPISEIENLMGTHKVVIADSEMIMRPFVVVDGVIWLNDMSASYHFVDITVAGVWWRKLNHVNDDIVINGGNDV